jgi:hypothetical protein
MQRINTPWHISELVQSSSIHWVTIGKEATISEWNHELFLPFDSVDMVEKHFFSTHFVQCLISKSTFTNIHIDDILVFYGCLFFETVFSGSINGSIRISERYSPNSYYFPDIQTSFHSFRDVYYAFFPGEFAIDIGELKVSSDFSIRGIPSELIRINPDSMFVISQKKYKKFIDQGGSISDENYWKQVGILDDLYESSEPSKILVVSTWWKKAKKLNMLTSIDELRSKDLEYVSQRPNFSLFLEDILNGGFLQFFCNQWYQVYTVIVQHFDDFGRGDIASILQKQYHHIASLENDPRIVELWDIPRYILDSDAQALIKLDEILLQKIQEILRSYRIYM